MITAVVLVAIALPAAAWFHESTSGSPSGVCLWWRGRQIRFRINAAAITGTGCTVTQAEQAIANALATWGSATRTGDAVPCTDFDFVPDPVPTTSLAIVANDGVNLIVVRKGLCTTGQTPNANNCWSPSYGLSTIGYTTTHENANGEIVDADMELYASDGTNGFNFTCDGLGGTDLQAVATHEAGHMLGLAHVCSSEFGPAYNVCPSGNPVMAPSVGDPARRALAQDDVSGVCAIYPVGAATLTCAPPDEKKGGGCQCGGGTGILGLLGLAFAFRRRRSG